MHSIQAVGMDVSKATLDLALLNSKQEAKIFQFANTGSGISRLISVLKERGALSAPLVCESTGEYHRMACFRLTKAGFQVNCINPLITKKYERASIRGGKSDRVDAIRLAQIGLLEANLPVFADTVETIRNQKLSASLAFLEKERQRLSQHLKRMAKTKEEFKFAADLRGLRAIEKALNQQIIKLKKKFADKLPANLQQFADTTKGCSQAQLGVLFALLGHRSFATKNKLVAFVGLDVNPKESGQWQGVPHISKRGNPYVRKVLAQVAWGLMMHNDQFKQYYQSLRNRGKDYRTCLVALSRKFLRQLYAVHFAKRI